MHFIQNECGYTNACAKHKGSDAGGPVRFGVCTRAAVQVTRSSLAQQAKAKARRALCYSRAPRLPIEGFALGEGPLARDPKDPFAQAPLGAFGVAVRVRWPAPSLLEHAYTGTSCERSVGKQQRNATPST